MSSEISNLFNPQTEQKFRFWMSWLCVGMSAQVLINCYFFVTNFGLNTEIARIADYFSYFSFGAYAILQILLVFFAWQTLQKHQFYTKQQDEYSLLQLLEVKYKLICLFVGYLGLELVNHIFWRFVVGFLTESVSVQF
jgi:hypothetical protein